MVNRKNINDIIKTFVPATSELIGAPRKAADLNTYLKSQPASGHINFYEETSFINEQNDLPHFFDQEIILRHANYLARLNNARVWGANGAVIAAGDYFITDVSREFNKGLAIDHSLYYTIRQVKSKMLPGIVAVIGTAGANIYYHWMIDILPRLGLVANSQSLGSIDHFITQFAGLPFQLETLEKIEIPVGKIIASNSNRNFHVKTDALFVPSLAGPLDQPDAFQVNFLRSLYKDDISTARPSRHIYISRQTTGRRLILNEDELLSCLSRYNFEIIYCEEMTVAGQVKLFSEAAVIICSHGSALTNLVFCNPGAQVLDIFNNSHINSCFWFISRINKLNYHMMCGTAVKIDDNPKNDNTVVDIKAFKKMLSEIGIRE